INLPRLIIAVVTIGVSIRERLPLATDRGRKKTVGVVGALHRERRQTIFVGCLELFAPVPLFPGIVTFPQYYCGVCYRRTGHRITKIYERLFSRRLEDDR